MNPAFSSTRGMVALTGLLLALLVAPRVVSKVNWLKRSEIYPTISWRRGAFPWIQQKIYAESGDVDIAMLGSSMIWSDVDAVYLRGALSGQLRRPAEVFTLGWNTPGLDAVYVVARDLLDRRRCRMLVVYDEPRAKPYPHPILYRALQAGEFSDATTGLARMDQVELYAGAVLSLPRRLLSLMRRDLVDDPGRWQMNPLVQDYGGEDLTQNLGSLHVHRGWNRSPDMVPFAPGGSATPADVQIYSSSSRQGFVADLPMSDYQRHFARELARLCAARGTVLVFVHMPELHDPPAQVIHVPSGWPEALGAPAHLVGIPDATLLGGIAPSDWKKMFWNDLHLNQNGQALFTPLITPALLQIYATSPHRF